MFFSTISKRGRRNFPTKGMEITHFFFSSSTRPIAKFEQCIEEPVQDNNKSKGSKHPGSFHQRVVCLPEKLREAVDKLLGNSSDSNLFKNAKVLNYHLMFKKPPLSEAQLKAIQISCTEKLASSYNMPDSSFFSAEEERKFQNSYNSKLKKTLSQNIYKWKPVVYNQSLALAYLVSRLAPDYASLYQIFGEIHFRDPSFQPQTIFDFGSGVGTALWAAKFCWGEGKLKEAFCVDSSVDMNNLALALIQGGIWPSKEQLNSVENENDDKPDISVLKGLYFRQFMPTSSAVKYDLVICAHTLLELPSAELRLQMALSLWRKSQGYLVFVEHGSRAAYEVIIEIRDFLMSLSNEGKEANLVGHVFAPCSHHMRCPRIPDSTPCNFEVRYESLVNKQKTFKEKYSYVVLKKGPRSEEDPQWPRVVRPVLVRSGHTICRLCTKEGNLEEIVVTRSKHSMLSNKCARRTQWGDLLPVQLSKEVPVCDELSATGDDNPKS